MIKTILGLFGVDDSSGPFTTNLKFTSGGTASADANTLDAYVEGTFTPALTFGGGNTGLTYSSRGGTYTRIGNMVFFSISIVLSAKGSSTGDVTVTSLPITVSNALNFASAVELSVMTAGVGDSFISSSPQNSTTNIFLYKYAAGSKVRLNDTDFTDTSTIRITGSYRV